MFLYMDTLRVCLLQPALQCYCTPVAVTLLVRCSKAATALQHFIHKHFIRPSTILAHITPTFAADLDKH